ncbi:MAG: hypothetical protein AABX00_00335 [Nanoarchaeota archaeon]|mgnify:CR=1 FL=1
MVEDVKKITLGGVFSWIFGIIFILASLGNFSDSSFIVGTTSLAIGLVILPPSRKFFKEKLNFKSREHKINKNVSVSKTNLIDKKNPNYKKFFLWGIIVIAAMILISNFMPQQKVNETSKAPKVLTKDQAYYKCLSKTKECDGGIPVVRLELMKSCKDIYLYTADAKELISFTNGMC